jgi:hypothetical protein
MKGNEGFFVNSPENNLPVCFYLRGDCYKDVMTSFHDVIYLLDDIASNGIMLDGENIDFRVCVGGTLIYSVLNAGAHPSTLASTARQIRPVYTS